MDVLEKIDGKCTGEAECDISITDAELGIVDSCYEGLRMHLEASYKCIPGGKLAAIVLILPQINQTNSTICHNLDGTYQSQEAHMIVKSERNVAIIQCHNINIVSI